MGDWGIARRVKLFLVSVMINLEIIKLHGTEYSLQVSSCGWKPAGCLVCLTEYDVESVTMPWVAIGFPLGSLVGRYVAVRW